MVGSRSMTSCILWDATIALGRILIIPVTIRKAASGIFYISDLMGGYYDQRAGYGSKYAMNGYIQLTNDNELFVLSGYVPGWGDSYDDFYDGSYDPDAQTLTYELEYAGSMQFHIILGYTKSL